MIPVYDIPGATVQPKSIESFPRSKYVRASCTSCAWAVIVDGSSRHYPTRYEVARVVGDHQKACPAAAVSA